MAPFSYLPSQERKHDELAVSPQGLRRASEQLRYSGVNNEGGTLDGCRREQDALYGTLIGVPH